MKWTIGGVVAFLTIIGLGLFVGPRMVDWNAYRPDIAGLVAGMTGRSLAIDGDVRLVLLPTPALSAGGVRLRNLDGASAPDMIKLKSLDVRVALLPLLKGRVVVESMVLVEPDVLLERLPNGRPNWQFLRPPSMDFVDDVGDDLAVNRLIVVGGSVSVTNAGRIERLTGINAEINAERLAGPFHVQGDVTWRGLPWRVDVAAGRFAPFQTTSVSATVGLRGGGTEARFSGAATLAADRPILAGALRGDLARFRDVLAAMELPLPIELAQRASIEATVTLDEERLGFDALSIRMADARLTGSAAIPLTGNGVGVANLKVGLVDLDKWPAPPAPPAAPPAGSESSVIEPMATLTALSRIAPGRWTLQGEGVRLRDTLMRDWRIEAEVMPGSVILREASGHLPGGTDLVFYGLATLGETPSFTGTAEFGTEAIRQPWAWLGLPLPPADPDRLRQASLTANIAITGEKVTVDELKLRVDGSRIDGAVSVRRGPRPVVTANLTLDGVNLGAYWPAGLPNALEALGALRPFDGSIALRTGPVTFGETAVDGIDLRTELRDGALILERLALSLKGDRLTIAGTVGAAPEAPLDLTATGAAADLRPWLRLTGFDAPELDLGPVSGVLTLAGPAASAKLRGDLAFQDGAVKAVGGVAFGPNPEFDLSATGATFPRAALRWFPELGFLADVTKPSAVTIRATRLPVGWKVDRGELGLGPSNLSITGLLVHSGLDAEISLQGVTASAATIAAATERVKNLCCAAGETLDGAVRVKLMSVAAAGVAVDEATASLAVGANGWTVSESSFRLWNGAGAAEGWPWRAEGLRLAVRGLDIGVMSSLIGMDRRLAGRLTGAAQFTIDPESGAPQGGGRISAQGLVLPGLDLVRALNAIEQPLAEAAPAEQTLAVGRALTAFSRGMGEGSAGPGFLQARLRLGGGEIKLEDGAMLSPGLLGALSARVDLAAQRVDGLAILRATRQQGAPPTKVRISGGVDRPILREDLEELKSYLAARAAAKAEPSASPAP